MDAAALRAMQAPIKERYSNAPKAARMTLTTRDCAVDQTFKNGPPVNMCIRRG